MATTTTSVNSATSSTLLIAADPYRSSLIIENTDGNRLYFLLVDDTGTVTMLPGGFTNSLVENGSATMSPPESTKAVYGIWAADGAGAATITAITDLVDLTAGAIENYADLKGHVAHWLRPNATPSADMLNRIPQYIAMAHDEINMLLATLPRMQVTAALTFVDGYATIPDRLLSVIQLQNMASPFNEILPMLTQIPQAATITSGYPCEYKWSGSQFQVFPPVDASTYICYAQGLARLVDDDDTNWVLDLHSAAYLYGALRHADRRLVDQERLAGWEKGFQESISSIIDQARLVHIGRYQARPSTVAV